MDSRYWQQKWDDGQIGFHQADVNKRLIKYWPQVVALRNGQSTSDAGTVLVPLCGKSLDMLWLHQQGHTVLGVELSAKAAQAFFDDNNFECQVHEAAEFVHYIGTGDAEGITILVGDIFNLSPELCKYCDTFYDRAAMIAMSGDLRPQYATNLARLLPDNSHGLLLTISYNQSHMKGPPFSVADSNARQLLDSNFSITELAHFSGPERVGNLAERGLETLDERVYLLHRYNRT